MSLHAITEYKDAKAADLRLSLDLGQRPGLLSKTFQAPWGFVCATILGASHQIRIFERPARVTFSETVACDEAAGQPLEMTRVNTDRYKWNVQPQIHVPTPREFEASVRMLRSLKTALILEFPGHVGAITALHVVTLEHGAYWTTYHAYPQTGELVATMSDFTWQDV